MYNFFSDLKSGGMKPRCVFIDSDSESIDELICGNFRKIYSKQNFLVGKENCGDLFAIGRF